MQYIVFDLLCYDRSMVARPWSDRRAAVEELDLNRLPIVVPPIFYSDPHRVMEAVKQHGLEGVVSKRMDAPYQPGKRSTVWIKFRSTSP